MSKENLHTPTPWHIQENFEAQGIKHLAIIAKDGVTMPCSISPMRSRREEDDANAALIVRAVNCCEDLREALEGMLKGAPCYCEIPVAITPCCTCIAKAALAKCKEGK